MGRLGELIVIAVFVLFAILVFGPIAKKAGYSRWWALLMAIPVVNIIVIWVFSFIKWPSDPNA